MIKILKLLDSMVVRIISPILVLIGLSVALMLTVGIFSRAVMGTPVFGLEEIMLIAIMWFYMLGASLASRERSHLSADFIKVISSNPKVWRAASLIATVISLGVAVMFVYWSWDLFFFGWQRSQSTPVFSIPWWVSQSSLLVASVLFVVYLVRDLIQEIRGDDVAPGNPSSELE